MAQGSNVTAQAEYASDAEVEEAIRALTPAQTQRLQRFADFRACGLSRLGLGISGDDLLQEAMLRTVVGARKWRTSMVTFEKHLIETMRSIASHAPDEFKPLADRPLVTACGGECAASPGGTNALFAQPHDGERAVALRQKLEQIDKKFEGDDEVRLLIEGLSSEMKGPEIQAALDISQTQYETIMTRLRRGLDRKDGWEP